MLEKRTLGAFRSLCILGAAALVTACSGGMNSSSPLPASATNNQAGTTSPVTSTSPVVAQSTSAATFGVVQTAHAGGTYNSTVSVHLSKAPTAGDVLVLFFETNRTSSFPYSGQVTWPASATGSQWSYDGTTSGTTTILHHVVQSGETGTYALNVGGTGSGWEDYTVAEIAGASKTNPVNARLAHSVSAGATSYTFGSGIAPTTAGTFPVAFFSAHSSDSHTWTSISSGWTIVDHYSDFSEMLATGQVQTGTTSVNATASLSPSSNYAGAADAVLLNSAGSAATPQPSSAPPSVPTSAPTSVPTSAPTSVPSSGAYKLAGCTIFGANDWFTTNVLNGTSAYVPRTIDSRSASIISNLQTNVQNASTGWDLGVDEIPNLATSSTNRVTTSSYHAGTSMSDPSGLAGSPQTMPWTSSFLMSYDKTTCPSSGDDCHSVVLQTDNCSDWETYSSGAYGYNSGSNSFVYGNGATIKVAAQPWGNGTSSGTNYPSYSGKIDAGGMPMMGTTDFGDDLSYQQPGCQPNCAIPHVIAFAMPSHTQGTSGYTPPATGTAAACSTGCSHALPDGARLVLDSSFACPSPGTAPQANLVCNQLKQYGMVLNDYSGTNYWYMRFGWSTNHSNPWNTSELHTYLFNSLKIQNFHVMTINSCSGCNL